jgi:hypothetical protein
MNRNIRKADTFYSGSFAGAVMEPQKINNNCVAMQLMGDPPIRLLLETRSPPIYLFFSVRKIGFGCSRKTLWLLLYHMAGSRRK